MLQIKTQNFEGPLDLLLKLIESSELEINQVSLSEVTEQYLNYLDQIEQKEPEQLADFLVVASKLIYIKSKTLLPQLDLSEADDDSDLEKQLKLYKKFIEATRLMEARMRAGHFAFSRDKINANFDRIFNPPKNIYIQDLKNIFKEVLDKLEPVIQLPKASLRRAISIKQKINHLRDVINQKLSTSFSELIQNSGSRAEVIVTFIGLLELVKQRFVVIEQTDLFGKIEIEKLETRN